MIGSLWPHVTDALVGGLRAADLGAAVVFDGPPPVDDATGLGVSVGLASPDDAEQSAGTTRQVWRDAGPAPFAARQENGTVRCTAWAFAGNDWDFATLRGQVAALLDGIQDGLAAISPLGLAQVTDLRLADEITWVQSQTPTGTTVEAMFAVAYQAVFA